MAVRVNLHFEHEFPQINHQDARFNSLMCILLNQSMYKTMSSTSPDAPAMAQMHSPLKFLEVSQNSTRNVHATSSANGDTAVFV